MKNKRQPKERTEAKLVEKLMQSFDIIKFLATIMKNHSGENTKTSVIREM